MTIENISTALLIDELESRINAETYNKYRGLFNDLEAAINAESKDFYYRNNPQEKIK